MSIETNIFRARANGATATCLVTASQFTVLKTTSIAVDSTDHEVKCVYDHLAEFRWQQQPNERHQVKIYNRRELVWSF